ncbi:MAG: BatA and WFA domain-containing protein [Bacteroidales bacterium]|nr:BatA and WFA domain-containing protein [Bacteroidales bacterium]
MQFAYPHILFFLFALLIPLIIHLFNFQRYKIQYFSNTSFLRAIRQQHQRESEIKKRIILCLRMLAIAALITALAKPYIPAASDYATSKVMIYIDNSFSMENKSKNGNLLHEAKQQAKAIADAYGDDVEFYLLTNDFKPEYNMALSKQMIKEEIEKTEASPSSPSFSQVYRYAVNTLRSSARSGPALYYISDFQLSASDWQNITPDTNVHTFLVPLKAPHIKNICIDSVWILSPDYLPGTLVSMGVRVKNYSDETMEAVPLKIMLNNKQKALSSLSVEAGNTAEIIVNFMADSTSIQSGYVEITDNPIVFDDRMYFSIYAGTVKNILQLYTSRENTYISTLFGADSTVNYQTTEVKNVNYSILKEQQLVLLETDNNLSDGLIQAIEQYVSAGGNLLLFPSESKETYHNDINMALGTTLLGKADTAKIKIDKLNTEHVIFKNVFEQYPENIDLPEVKFRYVLDRNIGNAKEDIMTLENGESFLTAEQHGSGMVYTLASPLSLNAGNMVEHALFVPAIWNMTFSMDKVNLYYTIGNNELITVKIQKDIDDKHLPEIKAYHSDMAFIPEVKTTRPYMQLLVYHQVNADGIYALNCQNEHLADVAFNYSRKESQMEFEDAGSIKEILEQTNLSSFSILDIQHKSAQSVTRHIRQEGTSLSVWFILLCLACLLAESTLLRRYFTQS